MDAKNKKLLLQIIIVAILFAAALLVTHFVDMPWYAELIIYCAIYLAIGYKVLIKAAKNILHGKVFDENFLMVVASIGALAIAEYPEAVAVMLFYQIGELFEHIAVGKTRRSISAMMDIAPSYANVWRDGKWEQIDPEEVSLDDKLLIKSGEKIPVDGVVTNGASSLNTAAITGESAPMDCKPGDTVYSGSINVGSAIEIVAKKEYCDSTVAKILELVEDASSVKAPTEQFITKFAKYYTPAVVLAALIIAIIPPLCIGDWSGWINKALMFLVVSCPCALVISVPLSFFAGIGSASKKGILIKGGNFLELLNKVNVLYMDKTGTMTKGNFEVSEILPADGVTNDELIELCRSMEQYSTHPIAKSILAYSDKPLTAFEVTEISGKGLQAQHNGDIYYVGSASLMREHIDGFVPSDKLGTTIYAAKNNDYLGCIVLSDIVKPTTKDAIARLKAGGSEVIMLTGDNAKVAASVAGEVGVNGFEAGLLPQDKVAVIDKFMSTKPSSKTVAFVGDGINDAPSLIRADLGIAMGGIGSEVAIESADVVLMHDDLESIVAAKKIASKTMTIVKENIVFALAVKLTIMVLSILGIVDMWFAVFADVGVSVIAILNAMRCLRLKK